MQRPAGGVVEEEVVAGHVEGFGQADDGVRGRGDVAVLVAADLAGVAADLGGEVTLGPTPPNATATATATPSATPCSVSTLVA